MVRFLHTADWQLGMTRRYFDDDAQARFCAARFDAVAEIARIAKTEECEFVVVAGDVFETNQLDRKTVRRALEAMAEFEMPVFLLPGNHDPLDAATVYRSSVFAAHCPANVRVLVDGTPVVVREGVEVVGAPWFSKRPLHDLVGAACATLAPTETDIRVLVAHGALDALSPDASNPALIETKAAEAALASNSIQFLALGDRHSRTSFGDSGRIWYAGTPEPTAFDEVDPGHVLVVDCDRARCDVKSVPLATWRFVEHTMRVSNDVDVAAISGFLHALPHKNRTVVKLVLVGTVSLSVHARLLEVVENAREVFAALMFSESRQDLVVIAVDEDFSSLPLAGFAKVALDELRALAQSNLENAAQANDALSLLTRLARRDA